MEINNYNIDSYTKNYLDRCVDKFRIELLNESYLISKKCGNGKITPDIIDKAMRSELKQHDVNTNYRRNRKIVFYGILVGLLYTMCGCIVFFIQNTDFNPEKELGQFIIGIGLMLVLIFTSLSFLYTNKKRMLEENQNRLSQRQFLIVEKWSEIEKIVSSISNKKLVTIQSILPELLNLCKDLVSNDEISSVLYLRNKVLHEDIDLSDFEIYNAIGIEDKILAILKMHYSANVGKR